MDNCAGQFLLLEGVCTVGSIEAERTAQGTAYEANSATTVPVTWSFRFSGED